MNEPSLGELARRLDQLYTLAMRLVSIDVYDRDRRENERNFANLERDIEDLRKQFVDAVEKINARLDKREERAGDWRRQAIYAGILPAVFFTISTIMTILLATRSGK